MNAMKPESVLNNEQTLITIDAGGYEVSFKQIAGLLARRIVCNLKVGDRVERGQRIGLIKFGSRVDVLIPAEGKPEGEDGLAREGRIDRDRCASATTCSDEERCDGSGGLMTDEVQTGAGGKVRRQPSRGMYVLPSLFTAGNMAAGYYAITQSIQGSAADTSYFDRAALAPGYCCFVRWARRHHCKVDQHGERFRQGAGLACGCDHVRGCAEFAGLHLGISHAAGDGASGDAGADRSHWNLRLLYFSGLRSKPIGAVQHQHQSAAEESRQAGKEVFCRDADSGGARRDQFRDPFPERLADRQSMDRVGLAVSAIVYQLSDGEQLAVLECQGAYYGGRRPFQLVAWIVTIGTLIALYHRYMLIIIAMAYLVSGVVARLAYSWGRERRHSTVAKVQ